MYLTFLAKRCFVTLNTLQKNTLAKEQTNILSTLNNEYLINPKNLFSNKDHEEFVHRNQTKIQTAKDFAEKSAKGAQFTKNLKDLAYFYGYIDKNMEEVSRLLIQTTENSKPLQLEVLSEVVWALIPIVSIEHKKKYWPLLYPEITQKLSKRVLDKTDMWTKIMLTQLLIEYENAMNVPESQHPAFLDELKRGELLLADDVHYKIHEEFANSLRKTTPDVSLMPKQVGLYSLHVVSGSKEYYMLLNSNPSTYLMNMHKLVKKHHLVNHFGYDVKEEYVNRNF